MGLAPAVGLGILSTVLSGPQPLLGSGVMALVYITPYALTLAVSLAGYPPARGGLLLALGLLSLAASFSAFSLVTLILLPAIFVILLAGTTSLSGHNVRVAVPFFLAGLLGAALVGVSFYALFGLEADEPRCWYGVTESGCTSDIISHREAGMALGALAIGTLPFLVVASRSRS